MAKARVQSNQKRKNENFDEGTVSKKIRHCVDIALELGSMPIAVVVGHDEITFHVHECLLTSSSQFFKNALKNDWKEKTTRTITLPDHESQVFKIYADWMYTGRLCTLDMKGHGDIKIRERNRLRDCYALGNFFQDSSFRDTVIDAIIEKNALEDSVWVNLPHHVYGESRIGSPHRKLVIDLAVMDWECSLFDTIATRNFPVEFLTDLLTNVGPIICDERKAQSPSHFHRDINTCKYHEHIIDNTPCYKSKRGLQDPPK